MASNPQYLGLAGSLAARPRRQPDPGKMGMGMGMQSAAPFRSNDTYQQFPRGGGFGGIMGIDPGAAAYGAQGTQRLGNMLPTPTAQTFGAPLPGGGMVGNMYRMPTPTGMQVPGMGAPAPQPAPFKPPSMGADPMEFDPTRRRAPANFPRP